MTSGRLLDGRRVLVVGASRGIGAGVATAAAAHGAHVAISARTVQHVPGRSDSLEAVTRRITESGGRVTSVPADITRPDEVGAMVEAATAALGGLDSVIVTVAMLSLTPALDTTADRWRRVLDTTLTGPWLVAQAALPVLARSTKGLFAAFSTAGVDLTSHGANAYWVAKAGLERLVTGLDADWSGRGVRCCCIRPSGVVLTEGWAHGGEGLEVPPEMVEPIEHVSAMVVQLIRSGTPAATVVTTGLLNEEQD